MKVKFNLLASVLAVAALAISCNNAAPVACVPEVQEPLVPGEQAPPQDPGQKGFGSSRPATPATGTQPRPQPAPRPQTTPEIKTVPLAELSMSDPYILADPATKTYYLTSTGGRIYTSPDLQMWTGPYQAYDCTGTWMEKSGGVAAAEIHYINGKYYYIAPFSDRDDLVDVIPRRYNIHRAQSMILVSDTAKGPYKPIVDDYDFCLYPRNWAILDGTLWSENGKNYVIFVHEWLQTIDGTMEYMEMSDDFSTALTKPKTLFRASEAPWVYEMNGNGEATYGMKIPGWVTDGPELFRTGTGRLGMLWTSWVFGDYTQGVAYSESGTLDGPWIQEPEPVTPPNYGHGMLFRTLEGRLMMSVHSHEKRNGRTHRVPHLFPVDDSGDKIKVITEEEKPEAYLMVYHKDQDHGLHMAYSEDGYTCSFCNSVFS